VILVLPPGWCRFVMVPAVSGKEQASKKAHNGCCDLCRCKEREKPRPEPKRPTPPFRCCCYELHLLKPNPPEKPVVDTWLLGPITPPDSASTGAVLRHDLGFTIPGPSPPLHVLKCVWLC
jgi:hypothetical protein